MGESSVIEWTDSTWNPWRGCDKVSPACSDCYMFRDQLRYGKDPYVVVRAADGTFFAPVRKKKWIEERERHIAEKGRHLVFTCSWSDWFHVDADDWRDEAWEIIRETPRSTYQVLTKRTERIADCLPDDWGDGYPNVWLGTTIENRRFVSRADDLRAVPAASRFISAEPLIGPIIPDRKIEVGYLPKRTWQDDFDGPGLDLEGIDWVIGGGESGGRPGRALVHKTDEKPPRYFPKEEAERWMRDLRDACLASETAFHFKQWGGSRPESGGRLLDGRTYDEMPDLGFVPVGG